MKNNINENPQNPGIMGESVLALISVALAAFWIAFAYYKGGSLDADGNKIMLLHPLVPIALIGLLIRIYKWVGIKFVVQLEIIMISLWLFLRMLGVLMPFILGFGFAYLFRFLWKALPFKKYYQRAIATALIVLICSGVLILTGLRVGNQVRQMTKGIQIYYHETLLPLVIGEQFTAFAIDIKDKTETGYIGTDHGIYILQKNIDEKHNEEEQNKKIGITNGTLVGQRINAIAVGEHYIYAGTDSGLYRCPKKIVQIATGEIETSLISLTKELKWAKVATTQFDNLTINAIDLPPWDPTLMYVGTNNGLFEGYFTNIDSSGKWKREKIDNDVDTNVRNIVSVDSIEKYDKTRKYIETYVASTINNNEDIEYQVHKRPANSITWAKLDSDVIKTPILQVILASDRDNVQLFAGTPNGIFERDNISKFGNWKSMEGSGQLPQSINLLGTHHSGKYAGNENVIYYNHKNEKSWNRCLKKKEGFLIYSDDPTVKQFQEYLTEKIPGWAQGGGTLLKWLSGLASSIAFQFGGLIATVFLAFIVFVYANQGLDKYFQSFLNIVPEKHRQTTRTYLSEIDRNMHQFLKGQLTVIVLVSIISCIVYRIIGVPFALLIGVLAGFCNAVPTFGPFIGGGFALIAMLMGYATGEFIGIDGFLIRCVFVLGAIFGIQAIDNSLISPKVMSNAVHVDPLLIMFAVFVGASILGFWGVLLAIPTIVVIKSIITVSKTANNGREPPTTQEQS